VVGRAMVNVLFVTDGKQLSIFSFIVCWPDWPGVFVGRCLNGPLSEIWLMCKGPLPKRLIMFIFAGFAWALWTTRNKMSIEQKFPKAPTDVVYLALSYLQKWSVLLKDGLGTHGGDQWGDHELAKVL